jgi:hypothetical protein
MKNLKSAEEMISQLPDGNNSQALSQTEINQNLSANEESK